MTLPPTIGLASQIYAQVPLRAALERLAAHAQLVEIDSFGLHTVLSPRNRRDALASGLRLTVHGPYGPDILPGSPDETLRRHAIEVHRRHIDAALEMGAILYNVHPDDIDPPAPRDPAVTVALQRTVADLEAIQRETGLPVAIENMSGRSHFMAPGDLDLGELGLTLDAGHAAISGALDEFLRAPRARLAHVHLHSNQGPGDIDDPHGPLGQGVVDAARVLAVAHAAGATVILEHLNEADALASITYLESQGLVQAGERP
jgi:sugar phosphate isomerase/epimerase